MPERCPLAVWRPLPEATSEPRITATQLIIHTMVGTLRGTEHYFEVGTSVESHYGLGCPRCDGGALDGVLWQWMSLDRQADANREANVRAHSVETCDHFTGGTYTNPGWSARQMAMLVRLGNWEADHFAIPRRVCRTPTDPGFGWHAMWDNTRYEYPDGSTPWTPSAGKTCPNPTRVAQLKTIVLPTILAGRQLEDDMPLTDTDLDAVERRVVRAMNRVGSSEADPESLGEAKLADDGTGSPFRTGVSDLARRAAEPLLDDEQKVIEAVGAVTFQVGATRASILAALAALDLDLTPAQIAAIAAAVDVDEAAVADAVRFRLHDALAA